MPLHLTIISLDFDSDEKPRTLAFEKELIKIGREKSNDIVLNSEDVSGFHAQLRIEENGNSEPKMFITDLGSTNGTKVENTEVKTDTEVPFDFTKRISIGSYLIKPAEFVKNDSEEKNADASSDADKKTDTGSFKAPRSRPSRVMLREDGVDLLSPPRTASRRSPFSSFQSEKEVKTVTQESDSDKGVDTPESSGDALSALQSLVKLSEKKTEKENAFSAPDFVSPEKESEATEQKTNSADSAISRTIGEVSGKPANSLSPAEPTVEDSAEVDDTTSKSSMSSELDSLQSNTEKEETPMNKLEQMASEDAFTPQEEALVTISLEGSDISDLDFVASELFELKGKVVNKGMAVPGVKIEGGEIGDCESDSSGNFTFGEAVEGTKFFISASKDGYRFEIDSASGDLDCDKQIEISGIRLLNLGGKIIHRGEPMAGVTVNAGPIGSTTTLANGTFSFEEIDEDTQYEVSASKTKFVFDNTTLKGKLTENEDSLSFSAIKLLSISGRVMHKGSPMEGVEIDGGPLGKTVTDQQGYYCFTDVPDGTNYTLTARKGKFTFGTRRGTSGQ